MSNETSRQTGSAKTARNPVKIIPIEPLKKPDWIRVKFPSSRTFYDVKRICASTRYIRFAKKRRVPTSGNVSAKGLRPS